MILDSLNADIHVSLIVLLSYINKFEELIWPDIFCFDLEQPVNLMKEYSSVVLSFTVQFEMIAQILVGYWILSYLEERIEQTIQSHFMLTTIITNIIIQQFYF